MTVELLDDCSRRATAGLSKGAIGADLCLAKHAFSAAAEGAGAPEIESSSYTSSSTSQTSHQTITAVQTLPTGIQTNAVGINGTITAIPNLWSEHCSDDGAPCTAYCHSGDTDCQKAANAIAKTSTDVPSGNASGSTTVVSAVLNGTTLYSPTVYISIATAYATNECSNLGQRHHATFLAMNPSDVSTQIQLGGKAWANSFGAVRYEDLTGLPPASNYQLQPSCIMFGCPTMDNHFSPTLSVPAQLRSMDAAWKDCGAPLQGLTELAFIFDPYTGQDPVSTRVLSSPAPQISEDAEGALAPNSPVPQTTTPSPVAQTIVNSAASSRRLPSVAIDGPGTTIPQSTSPSAGHCTTALQPPRTLSAVTSETSGTLSTPISYEGQGSTVDRHWPSMLLVVLLVMMLTC
ncbi:uncharacterized protein MYCGRDRAFT_93213 [Zymoseptoria tritici IPO323]|uniref:Uncharacterized protein n=1 Tax=Zymoseptoria tritici (strain CBS 115943 / IPO323) TaxID=336722 RepID=F9XC83_ZYMTI|nr:uncharacterized protein MYCGRDRAFT_93213 [Zymoseptoria tritici IPO323]EGP87162.1 hypothetical protein MYCGRDRAFT_93213 [Zymoseptoria tritici IPO323]